MLLQPLWEGTNMPMPDLNTLMQFVNTSQQNTFIPAFQQSEQAAQERAYKQQQMDKILQEMRLAEQMAPIEQRYKESLRSGADANTQSVLESTRQKVAIGTPESLAAQALQPELQNQLTGQNITDKQHSNYQSSLKSNEDMRKAQFINDFMLAEDDKKRQAVAESDPEMWMKLRELASGERKARVAATTGRNPTAQMFWASEADKLGLKGQEKATWIAQQLATSSAGSMGKEITLGGETFRENKVPSGQGSAPLLSPEERAKLIQKLQGN